MIRAFVQADLRAEAAVVGVDAEPVVRAIFISVAGNTDGGRSIYVAFEVVDYIRLVCGAIARYIWALDILELGRVFSRALVGDGRRTVALWSTASSEEPDPQNQQN